MLIESFHNMSYNSKTPATKLVTIGIILAIVAAFCNTIMNMLIKLIANNTTESMVVFFRFLISTIWVVLILTYKYLQGKKIVLKTKHIGIHVVRAICTVLAMFSAYYALKYSSLVNVMSLIMTYTIFIPIISFIFFGTKTGVKSWIAILVGFSGIVFILQPSAKDFNPISLIALISGLSIAASILGVHELSKDDKPYTIMAYYFPLTLILSSFFVVLHWQTPDQTTLIILIAVGVIGTIYQDLLTRTMIYLPPKTVSPILYFSVVFSGIFDFIFWQHTQNQFFVIGSILVTLGAVLAVRHTGKFNNKIYPTNV